jgi:hypothetical protein
LSNALSAVRLYGSLLHIMSSLPQVAHSTRQSKALEPFEGFESRDGAACLQVGEDASVLVVAFRLNRVSRPHKRQLELLRFKQGYHLPLPVDLRAVKFRFLALMIEV